MKEEDNLAKCKRLDKALTKGEEISFERDGKTYNALFQYFITGFMAVIKYKGEDMHIWGREINEDDET